VRAPKERLRFAARQASASDALGGTCASALCEASDAERGGEPRRWRAATHACPDGSIGRAHVHGLNDNGPAAQTNKRRRERLRDALR
jgi:hypothetical protein